MPIQRIVPQARQLPLPSPDLRYIDRNVTVDSFNRQQREGDYDRDRDLAYDQRTEDRRRQAERDRIMADAVLGALSGIMAAPSGVPGGPLASGPSAQRPQSTMPVVPPAAPPPGTVAQPWVNPDAGRMGVPPQQAPAQSLDPRAYGMNVARGLAGAGQGGAAATALDGVFAADQRQGQEKDRRYEQVLGLAARGDPQQAAALAQRYGIQIPPEILRNGRAAEAFLTAGKLYDDPRQAAAFAQEMLRNGGDVQAAQAKTGAPRGKPQEPRGSTIYDDQGGAYWAPSGGGALTPFTGGAPGARFQRGGTPGQTDPNLARSRALQNAKIMAEAAAGPKPGDFAQPDEIEAWRQRFDAAFQQELMRGNSAASAAGAGLPPPPPVPSMSMGGPGTAPPPEAVQDLLRNSSPRAIAEFDDVFGPGAAERALDAAGKFGDPD